MSQRRRREMAPGGRAHDADTFRINLPLRGPRAHGSDGTLRVLQHARMPIALGAEAIAEHERRHALLIEKERVVRSFMGRETSITATRANHDGRATGLVGRR